MSLRPRPPRPPQLPDFSQDGPQSDFRQFAVPCCARAVGISVLPAFEQRRLGLNEHTIYTIIAHTCNPTPDHPGQWVRLHHRTNPAEWLPAHYFYVYESIWPN